MAKERGIPQGSETGSSGLHEQGTQAPASGKNTLTPKGSRSGYNAGKTLTTGMIEGGKDPGTVGGVVVEGGLESGHYKGPGYDPEKTFTQPNNFPNP